MSDHNSDHNEERDPTDWDSRLPVDRIEGTGHLAGNAIQFHWWNLLLLIPLLMLITTLYNSDEPRLFGFPAFYWIQFLFVFVGVACVALVFLTTGSRRHSAVRRQERGQDGGEK